MSNSQYSIDFIACKSLLFYASGWFLNTAKSLVFNVIKF